MRKLKDFDSDDDAEIDVLITPKKPRLEIDSDDQNDQQYLRYWHHPLGHVAEWIVRTKNKFQDLFYINTVMNRLKLPFQDRRELPSAQHVSVEITIDDDADEDEEPVVVYEAPTKRKAEQASTSLLRPPLERKLDPEYGKKYHQIAKEPQNVVGRSRKKQDFIKPEALSLSYKCKPMFGKAWGKKPESSSVSNQGYPQRQPTSQFQWRGTTAQESIRLAEREKYRQLLEQFSSTPISPLSKTDSVVLDRISIESSINNTNDGPDYRKGSVLKQKLSNSFKEELKEKYVKRLSSQPVNVNQELPDVIWVHTSSPEVVVVERKMPMPAARRSPVLKEVTSRSENTECQVISGLPDPKRNQFQLRDDINRQLIANQEAKVKELEAQRDAELKSKLESALRLTDKATDHLLKETVVEVLPELTSEMMEKIEDALRPIPPGEVLVDAFKLQITRRDMETLAGLNWLNDEIINFYFNLLMERGKQEKYPSVYSCNTFFYPKLVSSGHSSLKRWTRRVDIFAHDLMLVPVHLGMHWCLAVVDFRSKKISYYDSMCGQNNQCLQALKSYLEAESFDKKKIKLDISQWSCETVQDRPNQLNGSDCGMFTCIYAEYISRDAKLSFTQEDMPYFRKRMVYEILTAQLL